MGILSDEPVPTARRGGVGRKFVLLYQQLDADDQAMIRRWDEDPTMSKSEMWRRLTQHFDIGYSSVERGLVQLRESEWAS